MFRLINAIKKNLPFCNASSSPPPSPTPERRRWNDAPGNFAMLKNGRTHYIFTPPKNVTSDSKELVVLLHGASVYSFIWNRFVQWFSERGHPVLVFDFYGHGFSECPNIEFTVNVFCEQFEQILEHLQLMDAYSSFILIGHSMGGLISSLFTSRHKELVSHLILINCAGIAIQKSIQSPLPSVLRMTQDLIRKTKYLDQTVHLFARFLKFHGGSLRLSHEDLSTMALALDEHQIPAETATIAATAATATAAITLPPAKSITDKLLNLMPHEGRRFAKAMSFLYQSWAHQCAVNDRAPVLLSVLRGCMLLDGDYAAEFARIDIPTLIVWGETDALLPKNLAQGMKTHIPHAEIYMVNGDHAAFLQKPADIFQKIVDFHEYGTIQHQNSV